VSAPRIAVCTYWRPIASGAWSDVPAAFVPVRYLDAITAAGGLPLLVPPVSAYIDHPELALEGFDGLCLIGGDDIDPQLYGEANEGKTIAPNRRRDVAELALLGEARSRDLPVLGICRGAQILNVQRGGTLVQELGDVVDGSLHLATPGTYQRHSIVTGLGPLVDILGTEAEVASHHHQGFAQIGEGLIVDGRAPDGVPEAIVDPEASFCIGVIWHPEEDAEGSGKPLFTAFVDAARRASDRRHEPDDA
jgi:putative glutamine amidotransferase